MKINFYTPSFGCSECPKGELGVKNLVAAGIERAQAIGYMDEQAPKAGYYETWIKGNMKLKTFKSHDDLISGCVALEPGSKMFNMVVERLQAISKILKSRF